MGRSVLGWVCLCALGVVPLIGCSETARDGGPECQGPADCDDGNECSADLCTNGACEATAVVDGTACTDGACLDRVCAPIGAFPCTEQGIIDAIAEGGGPHFFACNGPQTVVTEAQIEIQNDVVLDGEDNLTVDGNDDHGVIAVAESIAAELRGFTVTGGNAAQLAGAALSKAGGIHSFAVTSGGIDNSGVLTLTNSRVVGNLGGAGGGILNTGSGSILTLANSTVSGNTSASTGGGIRNLDGTLTLTNSTVSGNSADYQAGGISNDGGTATLTNSTVSGNSASYAGGIYNRGTLTLTDSTVSGNAADSSWGGIGIANEGEGTLTLTNTLVDDDCGGGTTDVSGGGNIESPGNTCGFDHATDQVNVSADDLKLGPLADNGGPTETHALLPGSVAIDGIPPEMCDVGEDQRGEPRPGGTMCDVGAFEVQATGLGKEERGPS